MGLRIRTNFASLNSQRRLSESTARVNHSYSRLASGRRINKAADDAAGLAISENLRADIRSLTQAKRNAADGVSLVQTAEGGLVETTNMLIRLRELAVQAASDTVANRERSYIHMEYNALRDEIDRIATATEFNGTRLLVGNREHSPDGLDFSRDNTSPLDIHIGANYYPEADSSDQSNPVNIVRINLNEIDAYPAALGIGASDDSDASRVDSRPEAQASISRLDQALTNVSGYRAYLGSVQNRLNSTISNLGVAIENLQESRSRILDTDFAAETARLTQSSIQQQAGISVLSQSNAQPNIALSLLK